MNRKFLSLEDRRAIDLILNHGATHKSGPAQVMSPACQTRVSAANKLLAMLDAMPAIEPPADLVARTMSRIDAASRAVLPANPIATSAATLH